MKRQLTFPRIRMIFTPISLTFILLMTMASTSIAFFPSAAPGLTLLDNNKKRAHITCPNFSPKTQRDDQQVLPSTFTLLNWNIYKQQGANWQTELQQWSQDIDLITLQEAKLSADLIQYIQQQKLFYLHNYAFEHQDFIYGVNSLSKVKPLSACGSRYREPWILIHKTAIASLYPIHGSDEPLLLINLHGVNFTFTKKPLIEQVSPYLTLIDQHNGAVIFSGDFNTWSDARLKAIEQALTIRGFSEVSFDNDRRLQVFSKPLDHIYYRDLKVLKKESITSESSDHTPQKVMFELE